MKTKIMKEAITKDSYGKDTYKALCEATVTVYVGSVFRQDVGTVIGSGKTEMDAIEIGYKGAVTDAMKRAFRTFGNQFGNCLYDKEKGGVEKAGISTPSVINTFAEKTNGMYPDQKKGTPVKDMLNDDIGF